MSKFITNDILTAWTKTLKNRFHKSGYTIETEYTYISKQLPFRAINMGKKNDEYFLDPDNKRLTNYDLLRNPELLVIKDFNSERDLSLQDKQAKKARSIADLYITDYCIDIILELEVFKDKPFSNLIYIPEVCNHLRDRPLYFIHCFAPKRNDKEAVLTQRIGNWLMQHDKVRNFEYAAYMLPDLPKPIEYLLPHKSAPKPISYNNDREKTQFHQYVEEYCDTTLVPSIRKFYAYSNQQRPTQVFASIGNAQHKIIPTLQEDTLDKNIIEITVNLTMISEVNPIIPAKLFDFFPPKEEVFRLETTKGYSINAYLAVNNHIHNETGQRMKIQDWWRDNKLEVGDTLIFEKVANRHYKINLLGKG